MFLPSSRFLIPHMILKAAWAADVGNEIKVESVLKSMEYSVLAFRDHIERVYESCCNPETLAECSKCNYNDCLTAYPNPQCIDAQKLIESTCSNPDNNCNVIYDKSQTIERIPDELADAPMDNPTDPRVIESVCFSRLAEPYMTKNFIVGHQMYFGSSTGAFRIVPAQHSKICGDYDPRQRPWFVAASSGPKDVVLVLDVSASMINGRRMELAKDAASTIVETLSVADRFAVITFTYDASQIAGERGLIRATDENKEKMKEHINTFTVDRGGQTNFYDAFATAFDTIDLTIWNELTSGCNVAILFVTDAEITAGPDEDQVISLVNKRIQNLETNFNQTTTIFTYSLGQEADYKVTKHLACKTNGIWTPVDDFADDSITAMSSYYKLFASGLGQGGNENWVAWIELYWFVLGGKIGTPAAAPADVRSVTPPLLLGVPAVDMYVDDFEQALGKNASSSTVLERLVVQSTYRCPRIELRQHELEALKFLGGGEMPSNVWANKQMHGNSYSERACCQINITISFGSCNVPPDPLPTALIVGVTFGAFAFILLLLYSIYVLKNLLFNRSSSINESVSVIAPPENLTPSAPPFNPAFSETEDA
ncbi:hypothetical protein ACHAW6_001759 [Cyclotella cf. meneghiniana]